MNKKKIKEYLKIASAPAVIASLCCLSPVILFSLGLVSLSVASELSNIFYGEYKWFFRLAGLLALAVFLLMHFRKKKNICTLDEAKKRKNEIINITIISLFVGVIFYILFLYGVVEIIGIYLGLW